MVRMAKSTKYFELFGGATLARLAEVSRAELAEVRQGERSTETSA